MARRWPVPVPARLGALAGAAVAGVVAGIVALTAIVAASGVTSVSSPAEGPERGHTAARGVQIQFTDLPPAPPPGPSGPTPPATVIDPCVPIRADAVNTWRTQRGLRPFDRSPSLEASSCAWTLRLAERRELVHGALNEVLYRGGRPGQVFEAWRASPRHHALLITNDPRVTEIGCVYVRAHYPDGVWQYYVTCRMSF